MMHFRNCGLIVSTSLLALADVGYGQVVSLPCTTDATNQTTVCGSESLEDQANTEAYNGTAFGFQALMDNRGAQNTAIGAWSLQGNYRGSFNTGVGSQSLRANNGGSYNTGIGYLALNSAIPDETGSFNTAVGASALQNNAGADNTAVGYNALQGAPYNINTSTGGGQGGFNTAIGVSALASYSTGSNNTASGFQALFENGAASDNTAVGYQALYSNDSNAAGDANNNTATGVKALYTNSSGASNTATGFLALYTNSTGGWNTAAGFEALLSNTSGGNNTAYGAFALLSSSTGSNNTVVGYEAGYNLKTGSSNIEIGNKGMAGDNKAIRIGTEGTQTKAFIAGIYSNTTVSGLAVVVGSNGELGAISSSERFKSDIAPMGANTTKLLQLSPVTFRYKADSDGTLRYGLIAEEVAKVYPELVIRGKNGRIDGVRYDELAPMLLNEMQKQQQKLATQDALIDKLVKQQAHLQAAFAKLQSKDELVAQR